MAKLLILQSFIKIYEDEEDLRMEPLRKADEMSLDLEKKQNYAPQIFNIRKYPKFPKR